MGVDVANIKQVAVVAGVSTATVSHVLNNSAMVTPKLRERVLKVVKDLNYQPNSLARSLITRRSKSVGMVITDITNPFYPAVVRGAEDVLEREGYVLIVGNTDGNVQKEESYYRTFRAKRVDGLLLITAPNPYPPAYLFRHNLEETPVVFINRDYPGISADSVIADNVGGSYKAVAHLLNLGHRRIAIITGPHQHVMGAQRLSAYEAALREYDLKPDPELIREGRFDRASGNERTRELLRLSSRPTAMFICNVAMTIGALQAIFESGIRFPGDLALICFDDQDWLNAIHPRITAVSQPAYELGATAAEILLSRISDKSPKSPCRKILKTELIVRESSGAEWLSEKSPSQTEENIDWTTEKTVAKGLG